MEITKKHSHSKKRVYESNVKLHTRELVFQNFGNASGRNDNFCLIKPSGVKINKINPNSIVSIGLDYESVNEKSQLKPSSDTPTHIELYNGFNEIGGIVHTHSPYAAA